MLLGTPLACCLALLAADAPPTDADVRGVVERSLPFVEGEGQRWIDEKKCVTCHQVPFMVWSLNAAADRGFAVDRQKLDEWQTWATDWQHMATKEQLEKGEEVTLSSHHDPVAQLLLGRRIQEGESAAATWPALFAKYLAAGQLDDGSWKAGGQLPSQKRPQRETQEVTTMWAVVALQSYAAPDETIQTRLTKARSWLGSQTAGESTEWWAVRLLLERGGHNNTEAERARQELINRQRADGGWGWLSNEESDAFGTGVALYALARDGMSSDDQQIAQGRLFLANSQQADGSWAVKGTKKDKRTRVEPTATYWGTCWAVIGLAETLPPQAHEK